MNARPSCPGTQRMASRLAIRLELIERGSALAIATVTSEVNAQLVKGLLEAAETQGLRIIPRSLDFSVELDESWPDCVMFQVEGLAR